MRVTPRSPAVGLLLLSSMTAMACAPGPSVQAPEAASPAPLALRQADTSPARSAEPPTERHTTALPHAACILVGEGSKPAREITLRLHGKPFARAAGDVERVEVRLADGSAGGTAEIASASGIHLVGDVTLADFRVRPLRPTTIDGWVEVEDPAVKEVSGASLRVNLELPESVTASKPPALTLACGEASVSESSRVGTLEGKETIAVGPGTKTSLRASPDGAIVGQLFVPPAGKRDEEDMSGLPFATVIDRKGPLARVRIRGDGASVVAWADERKLRSAGGLLGALVGGLGLSGRAPVKRWQCPTPTSLYVRDAGEVVRVGAVRAGASLELLASKTAGDELEADLSSLGAGAFPYPTEEDPDALRPFVKTSSLAACARR